MSIQNIAGDKSPWMNLVVATTAEVYQLYEDNVTQYDLLHKQMCCNQ